MASNPYVNKVIFGNETLIDLSSDTINATVLKAGSTAHDASGQQITGTLAEKSPVLGFDSGTFKINLDYGIYNGTINMTGIQIPVPASGTNSFYIDFPDNANPQSGEWTRIVFSVDSNGNSDVSEDISAASGVSF